MNKTAKKACIISGCVLGGIAALFLLLYLVLALIGCAMYGEARRLREYACGIPDLGSGFAPQGIAYSQERDVYIHTGYDGDNSVRLYLVNGKNARRVRLTDGDGVTLKGHAGGVACVKDNVYIANDSVLVMFSLDELINADGAVSAKRVIAVDNKASFCFADDEHLYVGEFYRSGNYETIEAHRYVTPSGEENRAIVSCYDVDENGWMSAEGVQPYPEYCISVAGLVQGFATVDGAFMLSRSYGLKNSALEYHSAPKDNGATVSVSFEKNRNAQALDVPLYYLDGSTLVKKLTLPAFSEDLTVAHGKVIVTNEASANKYFVGKLFGANKAYGYPIFKEETTL